MVISEHLPNNLQAVQEAKAVLRSGGLFIATCPHPFWDQIATQLGLLKGDFHESPVDKHQLINTIKQAGLKLIAFEPFMWAPVGFLPYLKLPVSPQFGLTIDRLISTIKILNWSFVNQSIIARKP